MGGGQKVEEKIETTGNESVTSGRPRLELSLLHESVSFRFHRMCLFERR